MFMTERSRLGIRVLKWHDVRAFCCELDWQRGGVAFTEPLDEVKPKPAL
jgi:hypothetical protein